MKTKLLYIGDKSSRMPTSGIFIEELKKIGDFTFIEDGSEIPLDERLSLYRQTDILLTTWSALRVPDELADDPGNLKYICHLTGEVSPYLSVKIIEAGIKVTNWGDAPSNEVAEGAMVLLMSIMKDMHGRIQVIRNDRQKLDAQSWTLQGMHLGLYGFGVIGRRFAEMAHVFGPVIKVFDPYVNEVPNYCTKVDSLEELFSQSEAVAIHAGMTEETRGTVNAELLAMLPDYGIVINTARGGIIDQNALFAELESGRLRAGLDVLDLGDRLPEGHPARKWENCIFTHHGISTHKPMPKSGEILTKYQEICLDNLNRYINGQQLRFVMDRTRYLRST